MIDNQKETNTDLSLIEIFSILKSHIFIISIITSIFLIFSIIYVFLIAVPDYKSNADVMIQVEQDNSSSTDSNYDYVNAFRLIDTVAELMSKDIVLEKALLKLNENGYTGIDVIYLRDGLSVNSSPTSYFITISFTDEDKNIAKDVVDFIIDSVIEVTDIKDAFPVLTNKIRRTSYSSEAQYNSPNKVLTIFLGFFLGLFTSIIFVFTKEYASNRFKNKDEVETLLKLPVLTEIPLINKKDVKNV